MDTSPLISRSNTQYEPMKRASNPPAMGRHVRTLFAGCRIVDCVLSEWLLACSIFHCHHRGDRRQGQQHDYKHYRYCHACVTSAGRFTGRAQPSVTHVRQPGARSVLLWVDRHCNSSPPHRCHNQRHRTVSSNVGSGCTPVYCGR